MNPAFYQNRPKKHHKHYRQGEKAIDTYGDLYATYPEDVAKILMRDQVYGEMKTGMSPFFAWLLGKLLWTLACELVDYWWSNLRPSA